MYAIYQIIIFLNAHNCLIGQKDVTFMVKDRTELLVVNALYTLNVVYTHINLQLYIPEI